MLGIPFPLRALLFLTQTFLVFYLAKNGGASENYTVFHKHQSRLVDTGSHHGLIGSQWGRPLFQFSQESWGKPVTLKFLGLRSNRPAAI